MREPRRDHYITPATGEDSGPLSTPPSKAWEAASLEWVGDAAVTLHLLASLIAEARSRLPRAVADARDQDCSWGQVADLLGVTRPAPAALRRRTERGRTPLEAD